MERRVQGLGSSEQRRKTHCGGRSPSGSPVGETGLQGSDRVGTGSGCAVHIPQTLHGPKPVSLLREAASQNCLCCFPAWRLGGLCGDGAGGGGQGPVAATPPTPQRYLRMGRGWQAGAGHPDASALSHRLLGAALVLRSARLRGAGRPGAAGWCEHRLAASRSVVSAGALRCSGEGQRTGSGGPLLQETRACKRQSGRGSFSSQLAAGEKGVAAEG